MVDERSQRRVVPAALLEAMADAAMAPLPTPSDDRREWLLENSRSFRRALLAHRDGARLHAGTRPQGADLSRALHKVDFLIAAGLPERDARMAMLTTGHFTVGSVLEEQAGDAPDAEAAEHPHPDPASAFDAGLELIVDGVAQRAGRATSKRP